MITFSEPQQCCLDKILHDVHDCFVFGIAVPPVYQFREQNRSATGGSSMYRTVVEEFYSIRQKSTFLQELIRDHFL